MKSLKLKIALAIMAFILIPLGTFSPSLANTQGDTQNYTENNWQSGNFESQSNIDTSNSPGQLFLKNDPSNMVLAFNAISAPKNIFDMAIYKDKLVMSACTSLYINDDAYVLSYDYLTNKVTQIYSYAQGLKEQGIEKLYVFNDKLYIAGADRDDGGWGLGAIYIYDGTSWTRKLTVPGAVHGYSLGYYHNKLYIFISHSTDGSTLDGMRLYESTNEGDSWTQIVNNMTSSSYGREIIVSGDKLAIIGDDADRIWVYDGSDWEKNKNSPLFGFIGGYANFNDNLYVAGWGRQYNMQKYTSDLATANTVSYFNNKAIGDLIVYDNKLYAVEHVIKRPTSLSYKIHYTSDGVNWGGYPQIIQLTYRAASELVPQLQQYHGRLYLGGTDGNVYVSASANSGTLVSNPINLALQNTAISWEDLVPTGTSLKFQIRTAKTKDGLTLKPFIGPDGTSESYYVTSGVKINSLHNGDTWLQYKVIMGTADPKFTPYLNSFSLTSSVITNNPPVLDLIGNKTVNEGEPIQFILSATDPDGDSLSYSANGLPTGASLTTQNFSWTPASGKAGAYSVTFSVSDDKGATDSETITINVVSKPAAFPTTFTLSNTNQLYFFRDKANLLQIQGSNFNLSTDFSIQFIQKSKIVSSFTSQPTNASILELNLNSIQINTLPVGFYDLKIIRTTDNQSQTLSKQILITELGDIWSPAATESSEQKRDGKVNIYDLSRLCSKWESTKTTDLQECDISPGPNNISRGKIDFYDADLLMRNWLP
jgi:hypothetical protein